MSKEEFPHEKDLKDEVTPDKAPKKDPKAAPKEEVKENPVENYEKENYQFYSNTNGLFNPFSCLFLAEIYFCSLF